jgi:hypothetical protein
VRVLHRCQARARTCPVRGPGAGHWARAAGPPLGLSLGVLRDALEDHILPEFSI